MLIGYARVSKADGSQSLDLQRDAGVDAENIYHDFASGARDDRPGLENCLRALKKGDVLVVWKLDRLGRNLAHLVKTAQGLSGRGIGLRVLAGQGVQSDTTTAAGRLVFGIFAALAEFEQGLIRERTMAGLKAARARGRNGGRKFALSKAKVRLAQAAMANRDTSVTELCRDLPLFLVSLKAGGTGLNLTAADTVIVYDPWWNPAVERQAMDRAHRIGQDKPVFEHRLIAENTVEAAIQRMQARKQALADALFEGTGEGPLALTEEDIHALFGPE